MHGTMNIKFIEFRCKL